MKSTFEGILNHAVNHMIEQRASITEPKAIEILNEQLALIEQIRQFLAGASVEHLDALYSVLICGTDDAPPNWDRLIAASAVGRVVQFFTGEHPVA